MDWLAPASVPTSFWASATASAGPDRTRVLSIVPTLFDAALSTLIDESPVFHPLQYLYSPAFTDFTRSPEEAKIAGAGTALEIARAFGALKSRGVKLHISDINKLDDCAFVPGTKSFWETGKGLAGETKPSTAHERWPHDVDPTIIFSPKLDLLYNAASSEMERSHVVLFGLTVCWHELGHLLWRFLSKKKEATPPNLKSLTSSRVPTGFGEMGETNIEEELFGFLAQIQQGLPHGLRITGDQRGRRPVVLKDKRVLERLRGLFEDDQILRWKLFPFANTTYVVTVYSHEYRSVYADHALWIPSIPTPPTPITSSRIHFASPTASPTPQKTYHPIDGSDGSTSSDTSSNLLPTNLAERFRGLKVGESCAKGGSGGPSQTAKEDETGKDDRAASAMSLVLRQGRPYYD